MAADDAAVVVTLRANLKDYEAALKTAVRQTERAAQAAEKAVSGIGKGSRTSFTPLNDNFQKSAGQIANDARVMQFQLNDIFSGLASGQGIRALQMQLGQIAQQLGGGGIRQAASTLGTAMIGMINPINLAVVAFGFAATAAANYFFASEEGSKDSQAALKKEQQAIDAAVEAWESMLPALKAVRDARKEALTAEGVRAGAQQEIEKRFEPIIAMVGIVVPALSRIKTALREINNEEADAAIKDFNKAVADLLKKSKDGTATVQDIDDILATLSATLQRAVNPEVRAMADELDRVRQPLNDVAEGAKTLRTEAEQASEKQKIFNETLEKLRDIAQGHLSDAEKLIALYNTAIAAMGTLDDKQRSLMEQRLLPGFLDAQETQLRATPSGAKEFLKTRAFGETEAEVQRIRERIDALDETFAVGLAKLFSHLPSTAQITQAARTYQEQAEIFARHQRMPGGIEAHPAAPPGLSHHEQRKRGGKLLEPAAVDITGVSPEELKRQVDLIKELETLKGNVYKNDKMHVQLAGQSARADKDAAQATVDAANAASDAAQRRADAAAKGQEAYDKEIASQQLAIDQQLKHNNMMTDSSKTIDQRKLAVEADTIAQQLNQQAEANGIKLTTERIAQHKELAMSMAQAAAAGTNIAQAQAKEIQDAANAIRDQEQALQQLKNTIASMATSAITGFVQDLRNGTDAAEALYNAVSRIADQLLQMALQKVFMMALGGFSGGGFVPNSSGGLYASGGYTGDKGRNQIAGVVHGGEYVINAAATQKHRALLEAINKGVPGYASGGFVLPRMSNMLRNQMATSQKPSSQEFNTRTTVVNTFDSGSFLSEALSRPDGVNVVLNAVRAQPGAFRSAMNG